MNHRPIPFKGFAIALALSLFLSACGSMNTTDNTYTSPPQSTTTGPGNGQPPDGQNGGAPGGGPGGGTADTSNRVTDVAATITEASTTDISACSTETTSADKVVCLANIFKGTLTADELKSVEYEFTEANAAKWSNLPVGAAERNGLMLGSLSAKSLEAFKALAAEALSGTGYQTLKSIILADEYLTTDTGNNMWDADLYYIAFLGEPSKTGKWMLQIGGHHYAANITFNGSTASATPMFVGVEPQTFISNGVTYEPLAERRDTMYAMIKSLDANQLKAATISKSFDDVLVGPGQDGKFPTSEGVLVSSLSDAQKELAKAAITAWSKDTNADISAELLQAYLSDEALSKTYIGWSGSTDYGVHGSYVRIDGPRVWIEFVCQTGVAYKDQIHFHTIWRDKTADYGGSFSS